MLIHILIHILIHVLISYTHSHIHSHSHFMCSFHILIHIFIHILISCAHFTYSFTYSFTYTHSCILIHKYSITYSFHILIHILLSLNESILLRNWNYSNWIIQDKLMAFSCQLVNLPITLGTVCISHFSGVLNSFLTLGVCTNLKLRF